MAAKSLLSKWLVEYTSPVVVTVSSAQAEIVSLQNGLLFHELLSAFGHLDGVNAQIRSVNHHIPVLDAHIRFERITEVSTKTSGGIEEMTRQNFVEFDLNRLSDNANEVKGNPPNGWTSTIEQIIMRSMSFSEFEMISHPLLILYVISTSDIDPIANMQELTSAYNIPESFGNGQYDPQIDRAYVIIHDNSSTTNKIDPDALLRQMKSKFPPSHTRLLRINSLPSTAPNLQHPDIWTRWKIPMFYSQHAVSLRSSDIAVHMNPSTNTPVLGARLSMEDFMGLRSFCLELFQQELIPAYERRVTNLARIVNDTKKGVKNVLKNFWRKPRDTTVQTKGALHYRYDRIESQILLLADTAFGMRDYDAALSMYKLVKDDYKADKATLHVAHVTLMIAACQFMLEPGVRNRELPSIITDMTQCIASNTDCIHANAYYSLMLSEILVAKSSAYPEPLQAAQLLLQASAAVSRLSVVSALLTERAAHCFLKAYQDRKYVLHTVIAGYKYSNCGPVTVNHSAICFATAMILHDDRKWGTLKTKLLQCLANKFKFSNGINGAKIALLLYLKILNEVSSKKASCHGNEALLDAVNAFHILLNELNWGSRLIISDAWVNSSVLRILNDHTPLIKDNVSPVAYDRNDPMAINSALKKEDYNNVIIQNLNLPELGLQSVVLMVSLNGSGYTAPFTESIETSKIHYQIELSKKYLSIEQNLEIENSTNNASAEELLTLCAERFIAAESEIQSEMKSNSMAKYSGGARIPLGEQVVIRIHVLNPLPIELSLKNLMVNMDNNESFKSHALNVVIPSGETRVVSLTSTPTQLGKFKVSNTSWELSNKIKVVQSITKNGPLLQRTVSQRANRERGVDTSLEFLIVPPRPLLRVEMAKNIEKSEVLKGQIIDTIITLENEGADEARDIDLLFNYAVCTIESSISVHSKLEKDTNQIISNPNIELLPFVGQSCSAVSLPRDLVIHPGHVAKLHVWLRLSDIGNQSVSVLVSYGGGSSSSSLSKIDQVRTSFTSFEVNVLPSLDITMSLLPRTTSTTSKFAVLDLFNCLPPLNWSSKPGQTVSQSSSTDQDTLEMSEGCCCVDDIFLLGGAESIASLKGTMNFDTNEKYVFNTSERLSVCVPIKYDQANSSPSIVDTSRATNNSDSAMGWQTVVDCFTFISHRTYLLRNESQLAKNRLREREMAGADAAPRTIQQVRRDRNVAKQTSQPVANTGLPLDVGNDMLNSEVVAELKKKHLRELIAKSEMKNCETTVAVSWVCKWRGKLCRGLHLLHGQSIVGVEIPSAISPMVPMISLPLSSPKKQSSSTLDISSMISIAICHNQIVKWSFDKGNCPVPVQLEFHSNFKDTAVLVSVDALDWIDISTSKRRPPVRGLRWEGKSRFVDIVVRPLSTVSVPFLALLMQKGVYNVNRFRITMVKVNDELAAPVLKVLNGQSFVSVQDL